MYSPPSFVLRSLLQHKSESSSSLVSNNHESHHASKHAESHTKGILHSTTTIVHNHHDSSSNSTMHETGFEKGKELVNKAIVAVSHTTKSNKI